MDEIKLPELPEPQIEGGIYNQVHKIMYRGLVHFTADQMREYARRAAREATPVAIANAPAVPLHDKQIIDLAGGYSHKTVHGWRAFISDEVFVRFVRQLPTQPSAQQSTEETQDQAIDVVSVIKTCWDKIDQHVKPGCLSGNGLDATAQRNGMILAQNILSAMISAMEKETP